MKAKIGSVLILLSCLGTALAISGREDYANTDVGDVVIKSDRALHRSDFVKNKFNSNNINLDITTIERRVPKSIQNNGLFSSKSWYVAPTRPVAVQLSPSVSNLLPEPTVAPPMPFSFIGRMIDGKEVTLFLSRNGRQFASKVAETLDNTYRIDEITVTDATFTYLPTGTQQRLMFNSSSIGSSTLGTSISSIPTKEIPRLHSSSDLAPLLH